MDVFVVMRKFNRDDQCEVICSCESYVTDIVAVCASEELAKQAALDNKKQFFDPLTFAFNHEPDEDLVYRQAQDDSLEVYAEDYDYGGEWGEFAVEWYIKRYTVAE